ncbi:hypothetical protein [Glycomyces xiaoerkulensis]|uniref:hypothetical protein n=1 Tax=Glycomyces xiaoerkulensis TaxID=2038139 RepID=UPI000C25CD85|nr:hypothetical protein [Glycomyces xiaoerkulensis]
MPTAERLNRFGRLPFLVALAVSALLLAVAFDHGHFGSVDRTTAVEEIPRYDGVGSAPEPKPAEVRIVESGFGTVRDDSGDERGTVGAIVRNTGTETASAGLRVRFEREDGTHLSLADLSLSGIPPGGQFYLGSTFQHPGMLDPSASELSLAVIEASSYGEGSPDPEEGPEPIEVADIDVVPLFAPAGGVRIKFEAETRTDDSLWGAAVVFRDETGDIVGGRSAAAQPLWDRDWDRPLPGGNSVHHLDLPEHAIPDGADLDRIEIGPSSWRPR